jgi:hypothetical protein
MSLIKILPLPRPVTDNFVFNQNIVDVQWYQDDNKFRNGMYIVSSSSYSYSNLAYKLFDGNNSTHWTSGKKGTTTNMKNKKYSSNPYNSAYPSSFIGGEGDKNKYTSSQLYWSTTATNMQQKNITIYGEWVQIKLPYSIYLSQYKLITETNQPELSPYKFSLLCSNDDGISWSLLDDITNPTTYTFNVNNVLKCNLFRLVISQIKGGIAKINPAKLIGFELYGYDSIIHSTNPMESFANYSIYSEQISSPQYINNMSSGSCGSCGIKAYSKSDVISTNRILENFQVNREPYTALSGNTVLNPDILYQQGNTFISKRDQLFNSSVYDYSGNVLYTNNGNNNTLKDAMLQDEKEYSEEERNLFILGTISVAIVAVGFIVLSTSE